MQNKRALITLMILVAFIQVIHSMEGDVDEKESYFKVFVPYKIKALR